MLVRTFAVAQQLHGAAWAAWRMRCYATARGEQGAKQAGVRLDTLKALPFSVSLDQAEQAFTKHQTSNMFLAQAQSWEKVRTTDTAAGRMCSSHHATHGTRS